MRGESKKTTWRLTRRADSGPLGIHEPIGRCRTTRRVSASTCRLIFVHHCARAPHPQHPSRRRRSIEVHPIRRQVLRRHAPIKRHLLHPRRPSRAEQPCALGHNTLDVLRIEEDTIACPCDALAHVGGDALADAEAVDVEAGVGGRRGNGGADDLDGGVFIVGLGGDELARGRGVGR